MFNRRDILPPGWNTLWPMRRRLRISIAARRFPRGTTARSPAPVAGESPAAFTLRLVAVMLVAVPQGCRAVRCPGAVQPWRHVRQGAGREAGPRCRAYVAQPGACPDVHLQTMTSPANLRSYSDTDIGRRSNFQRVSQAVLSPGIRPSPQRSNREVLRRRILADPLHYTRVSHARSSTTCCRRHAGHGVRPGRCLRCWC